MRFEETEDIEPAKRLLFVIAAYAAIVLIGACAFYLIYSAITRPSANAGEPAAVSEKQRDGPTTIDAYYGDRPSLSASDPASFPRPAISLGSPADWFSADDYPVDAQVHSREGSARAEFVIGVNGRVTKCRIIRSAGWPSLDAATCQILRTRAKFLPARDIAGTEVASTETRRVTWRFPE